MGAYLTLIGLSQLVFALFLLATKNTGRSIPHRIGLDDIVLFGVATHKLSYLLGNNAVASPIRAPLTKFQDMQSPSDVEEQACGKGLWKAVGELLICVFCVGQWIAAFFAYGLVLAPAVTRFVAAIFAILTVSDYLPQAYMKIKSRPVEKGLQGTTRRQESGTHPIRVLSIVRGWATTHFGPKFFRCRAMAFGPAREGGR